MKRTRRETAARTARVGTAATVALLSLQHQAHASTIHISGPITATGAPGYGLAGINVDGLGGDDLQLVATSVANFVSALGVVHVGLAGAGGANNPGNAMLASTAALSVPFFGTAHALRKLASGSMISAGAAGAFLGGVPVAKEKVCVNSACLFSGGQWSNNVPALGGFRFVDGSGTHFGWIRLVWNDTDNNSFPDSITALDWAYETTPDVGIRAGDIGTAAVPEPSSALLLLAGAGALALSRRRGAKKAG